MSVQSIMKRTAAALLAIGLLFTSLGADSFAAGMEEETFSESMTENGGAGEAVQKESEEMTQELSEESEGYEETETAAEQMTEETEDIQYGEEIFVTEANTEAQEPLQETEEAQPDREWTQERSEENEWSEEEWTEEWDEGMEEATEEPQMVLAEEAELATLSWADLPPSGTPVTGAPGWKPASMAEGFSPDFYPVRFYSGISGIEVFNSSESVVLAYYNGRPTFYPTKEGQGGKFGVIYRKVLYNGSAWYDLKITVVGYTSSVRSDGGTMAASYPYLGFTTDGIGWKFNTALGASVMKCEFLNSATGAVTGLNTRFQWWDVDAAQQFGILPVNGSISGRYYHSGGSTVYYQNQVSIAGISGMETVVGQGENAVDTDPAYCVAFELSGCSTYYMGIGVRDHIDHDENSYTQAQLERVNADLAAGTYSGTVEQLDQTDTSLNKIRTPAPVKSVSNDASGWAEQNTLAAVNAAYWYRIRQFVPWQDSSAYYSSFVIKDVLPAGADYAGSLRIIREEDQADVTGWFTVSTDKNVIMASANSSVRESASFYGYHYCLYFCAKMNTGQLTPVYQANRAEYTLKNQAETVVKHSMDNSYLTAESNTVTTLATVVRKEHTAPVKCLDGQMDRQEKELRMENETIVFSVFQEIPENDKIFQPVRIEFADQLEACLQFEEVEVKLKKSGFSEWEADEGWSKETSGQNIHLTKEYSSEYDGGSLRFDITCRIRKNYELLPWQSVKGETDAWITIPNQAAVTFEWAKGEPLRVEKKSNTATVKFRRTHLKLYKEIDVADIVWAHGSPVFTFKVEGTDLDGKSHTYYQSVGFYPENIGAGEKVRLAADFVVPAGTYTASEEKTMRYRLESIYSIVKGKAGADAVVFDLTDGQDGEAVFYNVKTTDEYESHTALARNHIGG